MFCSQLIRIYTFLHFPKLETDPNTLDKVLLLYQSSLTIPEHLSTSVKHRKALHAPRLLNWRSDSEQNVLTLLNQEQILYELQKLSR